MKNLADRYSRIGDDLHQTAAAFKDGAQALRLNQLKAASDALRRGLDGLAHAIDDMQKSTEYFTDPVDFLTYDK